MTDNKLFKLERNTTIIIVLLTIICLAVFGRVLKDFSSIFLPFVFAIFLTFLLNPIIDFFDRLHFPRVLSIILTSVLIVLCRGRCRWQSRRETPERRRPVRHLLN